MTDPPRSRFRIAVTSASVKSSYRSLRGATPARSRAGGAAGRTARSRQGCLCGGRRRFQRHLPFAGGWLPKLDGSLSRDPKAARSRLPRSVDRRLGRLPAGQPTLGLAARGPARGRARRSPRRSAPKRFPWPGSRRVESYVRRTLGHTRWRCQNSAAPIGRLGTPRKVHYDSGSEPRGDRLFGLGGWRRLALAGVGPGRSRRQPAAPPPGYDEGAGAARPEALRRGGREAAAGHRRRSPTSPPAGTRWRWRRGAPATAPRRSRPTGATPPCARPKPSPTSAWGSACATPATGRRRSRRSSASWNWSTGRARRSGSRPRRARSRRWRRRRRRRAARRPPTKKRSACATRGKIEAALKRFADAVALGSRPDRGARRLGRAAAQGSPREGRGRRCSAARSSATRSIRWPGTSWRSRCARPGSTRSAVDAYRHYIALRPNDPGPALRDGARAAARSGATTRLARSFETYVAMENRASEQRWVASAKRAIAALGRAGRAPRRAPAPAAPLQRLGPPHAARPRRTPTAAQPAPAAATAAQGLGPAAAAADAGAIRGSTEPPPMAPRAAGAASAPAARDPAPAQPR